MLIPNDKRACSAMLILLMRYFDGHVRAVITLLVLTDSDGPEHFYLSFILFVGTGQ